MQTHWSTLTEKEKKHKENRQTDRQSNYISERLSNHKQI